MHPSDPLYAQQWQFGVLGNIEKVWDEYSGAGIHVGVYDDGVDLTHPDLAGNYDSTRRVVMGSIPLDGVPNATTPSAHGTGVTGVIDAMANNGEGGVGVAWGSTFTSVDILDPSSPAWNQEAPYQQLVNFDIANHSWNVLLPNGYLPLSDLYGSGGDAIANADYDYASAHGRGGLGTIIVQAVANFNIDAQYSGLNASRFTISVAGIEEDGFAYDHSNYGACVLVTAPAVHILTTDLPSSVAEFDGKYSRGTGTSFAAPMVSGVAALMLQANPHLGWRDVQNIIAVSTTHTGSAIGAITPGTNENSNWFLNHATNWNGGGMHFSNDYGYGLLNAYNAVRMAEAWSLFAPAQTSANEQVWHNGDAIARAIPDNGTLQFTVSLLPSPAIEVEHVELSIDLTHSDYTQLRIFLVSPSGTETELFDGSGGTDATADTLFNWTYGLDALRGETAAGNWTVRIEDKAVGETGTLDWFNLAVYGSLASTNDVYHYTDEFLAMAAVAGQAARTTLADANGGSDWIDAAAVTGAMALDLNAGATTRVNGATWFHIAPGTTIENAVTGDGNDRLTGNAVANRLYGMRGNDVLVGGTGNDTLQGGAGNDNLSGGTGNDLLVGGKGKDVLSGGTGRDSFVFSAAVESVRGANRDTILAFKHSEHDVIDLVAIDANAGLAGNQAFRYIGADSFAHYHALHHSVIGMIRFAGGIVQGNLNANLAPDFEIKVTGAPSLLATDFHL